MIMKLDDSILRIALVEWLLREGTPPGGLFGLEARYDADRRRADVLVLGQHTHAYEIKSDRDSLVRLAGQLEASVKTFDYVTVVTTPRHLDGVRRISQRNVGLMLLDADSLKIVRKARTVRAPSVSNLIYLCSHSALAEALSVHPGKLDTAAMRELASRGLTREDVRVIAHSELRRRLAPKYDTFMRESVSPLSAIDLRCFLSLDRLDLSGMLGAPLPSDGLA